MHRVSRFALLAGASLSTAFVAQPRAGAGALLPWGVCVINLRGGGTAQRVGLHIGVKVERSCPKSVWMQTDHPLQTAEPAAQVRWTNPTGVKVVLGSKSYTRQLLLKEMGVTYTCEPADIDEKAIRHEDPKKLVAALANAKADALLSRPKFMELCASDDITLLLTSDQVVVHEGKIREKPETEDEAREFLNSYGQTPCSTVGAIAVTNVATGKRVESFDTATIHFSPMPRHVIETLVADPMTYKCAGGLMVEDERIQPYLLKIEGGMDSVMGLGKRTTQALLDSALA